MLNFKKFEKEIRKSYKNIGFKPCSNSFIIRSDRACCPLTALYINETHDFKIDSILQMRNKLKELLEVDDNWLDGFIEGLDGYKWDENYFGAIGHPTSFVNGFADGQSIKQSLFENKSK